MFFLFFFITKDKKEESEKVETPLEKNVIVENLKKESFTKTLKFSGFSEASRIVTIKSQVEGKISSKSFEKGKFYKAGSQLVLVDPEDKIAKLKEMEALLNQRKKEYEVAEKLFKKALDQRLNLVNQEQILRMLLQSTKKVRLN